MSTTTMTVETFGEQIKKDGIVFIDFWASWCGPCRAFAPIFQAASDRHPDITWAKVDTEAEAELASALEIRSIPTLMIFRDGILVFAQPGMLPGAALDELATKVRALDMAEVRRKAARAAASEAGVHATG